MTADERVDPRVQRSYDRIIAVATEILRESGAMGLTMEAVAARSGVAKTTIYRQFADRDELHIAVLRTVAGPMPPPPSEGGIEADLRAWLHEFAAKLREESGLVPSMIDAAERSPRAAELAREYGVAKRSPLLARIQRAIADGELDPHTDVEMLVGQLVGPIFYRRYISRQPIGRAEVDRLLDAVLRA